MITIVGTAHVLDLSEQVAFIVRHTWPDAVLVELDEKRLASLARGGEGAEGAGGAPRLYRRSAEYQTRAAETYGATPGGDLAAAISAGREAGADIVCIDKDAEQTMRELEAGMSAVERVRYAFQSITGGMRGRGAVAAAHGRFAADEEGYVSRMRRRFPTLAAKLIDERDAHMAGRVLEASERYKNMVVVVGDAHVRGVCGLLGGADVYVVRLADMMDRERMDVVRSEIWNRKAGAPQ